MWEGLGCVGLIYKIVEITAGSSNGGGQVLGLLCMGRAGLNLAVRFDFFLFFPCRIFLSVDRSHLRRNKASDREFIILSLMNMYTYLMSLDKHDIYRLYIFYVAMFICHFDLLFIRLVTR